MLNNSINLCLVRSRWSLKIILFLRLRNLEFTMWSSCPSWSSLIMWTPQWLQIIITFSPLSWRLLLSTPLPLIRWVTIESDVFGRPMTYSTATWNNSSLKLFSAKEQWEFLWPRQKILLREITWSRWKISALPTLKTTQMTKKYSSILLHWSVWHTSWWEYWNKREERKVQSLLLQTGSI